MLSLETCLKLQEEGWPQDRGNHDWGWAWATSRHPSDYSHPIRILAIEGTAGIIAVCPTLEELLEAVRAMVPDRWLQVGCQPSGAWAAHVSSPSTRTVHCEHSDLAEAVAALLLKLKGAE